MGLPGICQRRHLTLAPILCSAKGNQNCLEWGLTVNLKSTQCLGCFGIPSHSSGSPVHGVRDVCPSLGSFALSNNDVSDAQMIDPHLQHLTRPAHSPSFVCSAPRASLGLTKGAFLPLTFGTFKNTPPTPSHSLFSLQAA